MTNTQIKKNIIHTFNIEVARVDKILAEVGGAHE